jgi:hypothetical protein
MKTIYLTIATLTLAACKHDDETSASAKDSGLGRSAPQASTPPSKPTQPAEAVLQTSFEYYDGAEKRTVWLSNELVAEFAPSDAGREAVLRGDASATEEVQAQKGVRLWRVHDARGTDAFARDASSSAVRVSPVLHDAPTAGLPRRALPGGVVATFPKEWDRARIDAWLAQRNLAVESEVAAAANMYLVATPPGLEAIRIANELHETHELVAATPNFWLEMSAR